MLVRYDLDAELRNADAKGYGTPVDMPIIKPSKAQKQADPVEQHEADLSEENSQMQDI
jgi:hypothetical protein